MFVDPFNLFSLDFDSVLVYIARKPLRVPNSRFVAGIGLLAGCSFAALSSMQRLMGLEPNDREVAVYGALSSAELEKRTRDASIPNVQLIDSSANHD